jgi:hypothetical protein
MEDDILKAALAPGDQCLSLDQVGRYADGTLDRQEQRTAARHLAHCLTCQAELALMQAITAAEPAATRRRARFRLSSSLFPMAAAAAVVLTLVAAGSFYLLPQRAPKLPGSVTIDSDVTRSPALAVRSPIGDQQEAPRRFEWRAVDRAVRYTVRLLEVDRREVWATSTPATAADVPSGVQAVLVPGRAFVWEVTAYDTAGRVLSESGQQSFRIVSR